MLVTESEVTVCQRPVQHLSWVALRHGETSTQDPDRQICEVESQALSSSFNYANEFNLVGIFGMVIKGRKAKL